MSELNPRTSPEVTGPGIVIPDSIIGEKEPDVDSGTIAEYLSDISPLLTEGDIRNVLRKRGLSADTALADLTQRGIDLAEAEAYYKLCDQPVGGSTVKDVDGSWSHTEGGWTVSKANIDMWYKKYVSLREKWGLSILSKSTIRVHARGMRVWRRR